MRISVLDQSGIVRGRPPAASIRDTVALARRCETLGYHRFWVSEHHNHPAIAGSAPEVLLGALAMATSAIRIGSAGVMLPHYAPLKVAEQFRVLDALAPGRIDLGLGRGPGADRHTSYALKVGAMDNPLAMMAMDTFSEDVADVIAWSSGESLPDGHPFASIRAQPVGSTRPEHWIVGSSPYTARLAGRLGLPYCFAHFFHDGEGAAEALAIYRATFASSSRHRHPVASLCVWAIAAPTESEASDLFEAYALSRIGRLRGRDAPFPTPEDMATAIYAPKERLQIERLRQCVIHGTPDRVAARLETLAQAHDADEMVIVTMTSDPADRLRSYELIASALQLGASRPPPPVPNVHPMTHSLVEQPA